MTDISQTEAPRAPAKVAKPVLHAPKPTAQAAAPTPKARRLRYPCKLALGISLEMADSLKRLTATPDSMSESEHVRAALRAYCAHLDLTYRNQVMGGGNGS